jgi:uncharacterized protein DUF6970
MYGRQFVDVERGVIYSGGARARAGEVMTSLRRQLALVTFLMSGACAVNPAAPDSNSSMPAWLTTLIRQSEAQPVANPPAFIARYDYKGQTMYFLPQRCCDIMGVLYRPDGSVACHPDGGLSGTVDGRCADFFAERRNERIVWRDARGAP